MTFTAPEPLTTAHRFDAFDSGVAELNDWLRKRALNNQKDDATRTYVVTDGEKVVGYYAISSGNLSHQAAPGRFRRNMPNPIPVAILARLAIDQTQKGKGLGRALFRDGAKRIIHAADILGIRGLVVHAISDEAKAFYAAIGFSQSPSEPMTMMVTLSELRNAL